MAERPRKLLKRLRAEANERVRSAEFPELAKSVGMSPDRFNRFLTDVPKPVPRTRKFPFWFKS